MNWTITREWLDKHTQGVGVLAPTARQAAALGMTWPLRKGWAKRLIGTTISDRAAREFERLGLERLATVESESASPAADPSFAGVGYMLGVGDG